MESKTTICKNCENEHDESFEFCPHCGQQTEDDLTLGLLFYNTIANYFSFDARFLKSFVPLVIKPGYLAKKFLEGKRLLYLHPAQMYLFISVIFFFLFSFVARDTTQKLDTAFKEELNFDRSKKVVDSLKKEKLDSLQIEKLLKPINDNKEQIGLKEEEIKAIDSVLQNQDSRDFTTSFGFDESAIDSLIQIGAPDIEIYKQMGMKEDAGYFTRKFFSQMLKFYKTRSGGSVLQAFYDSIPIAMFFLLPIFAMILKLLYYRKGRFSHHLVFTFYFFFFLFTVFSFLLLFDLIWEDFPGWITNLVILSTYFYLFLALKRFYNQGWFLSFFKSGTATFMFFIFVIPLAVIVMGLTAFLIY